MKHIGCLLIFFCTIALSAVADKVLKTPLNFVPSDSTIVWGEDRSDFRATAMTVIPHPECKVLQVEEGDKKGLGKQLKNWKKMVNADLNIIGGLGTVGNVEDVLALKAVLEDGGKLFLQTGDADYINVVERMAFNKLMSVLQPGDGSFEKYQAAQRLLEASGMIYATDEEGIYVNFYLNSSTRVKRGKLDFVIDQLTYMPHSSRVKIRISGMKKGMKPIKLRLRMPDWAYQSESSTSFAIEGTPKKLPTIYVNGREENYEVVKGYLVIDREWNSGDEVFFDFPFHIQQLHPGNANSDLGKVVAFQFGPLVYGFTEPVDGLRLQTPVEVKEAATPSKFGHSRYDVVLKNEKGEKTVVALEPVMDGARYLWLPVE